MCVSERECLSECERASECEGDEVSECLSVRVFE